MHVTYGTVSSNMVGEAFFRPDALMAMTVDFTVGYATCRSEDVGLMLSIPSVEDACSLSETHGRDPLYLIR